MTKSRSRLEIWAKSRSWRLRSRLHHWSFTPTFLSSSCLTSVQTPIKSWKGSFTKPSFVWGDTRTKVPHGNETGARAAQLWGRAWDCSWNLWLKWIKANNKRRVTERAPKTLLQNLQMMCKKPMLSLVNNSCLMKLKMKNLCWNFCKYSSSTIIAHCYSQYCNKQYVWALFWYVLVKTAASQNFMVYP